MLGGPAGSGVGSPFEAHSTVGGKDGNNVGDVDGALVGVDVDGIDVGSALVGAAEEVGMPLGREDDGAEVGSLVVGGSVGGD